MNTEGACSEYIAKRGGTNYHSSGCAHFEDHYFLRAFHHVKMGMLTEAFWDFVS